jgi:hypothetical protein
MCVLKVANIFVGMLEAPPSNRCTISIKSLWEEHLQLNKEIGDNPLMSLFAWVGVLAAGSAGPSRFQLPQCVAILTIGRRSVSVNFVSLNLKERQAKLPEDFSIPLDVQHDCNM